MIGLLALIVILFSCEIKEREVSSKTIILVRHAEKIDESKDAALSEAGADRAKHLQFVLSSLPLDAVYATPYQRTINTVRPIAEQKSLSIESYSPDTLWLFSQKLFDSPDKYILVSGHSNTTPELANHLMGDSLYLDIAKEDYTNIFIINLLGRKVISNFVLHF
jgi:2,3-bisphosphoglycerate-dependent phosphoglycerate mutase